METSRQLHFNGFCVWANKAARSGTKTTKIHYVPFFFPSFMRLLMAFHGRTPKSFRIHFSTVSMLRGAKLTFSHANKECR
jgi:hypothetical protein